MFALFLGCYPFCLVLMRGKADWDCLLYGGDREIDQICDLISYFTPRRSVFVVFLLCNLYHFHCDVLITYLVLPIRVQATWLVHTWRHC
ncbi:hypothetical protein BDV97DRAFT_151862 [Delphinella strobiligena]|nr:hypothetical protein BDV97DRAFT_151862 [Delphinella strobiligena]